MSVRCEFDWDPVKAASNLAKHDIPFQDAMSIFAGPLTLSVIDETSSSIEERWITIGVSRTTRVLIVVHSFVKIAEYHVNIRIVSARKPNKQERHQCEQAAD